MFTDYAHVLRHLDGLGLFHMDLTLERMHRALARLGLEQPPFVTAQVVGTNGKGSTSTFLAGLAQEHGLRTGLYTSPHFVSPGERIRINGLPLPPDAWPALANAVMQAEPALTYFEFLTVLAALAFTESGVEVAVMEAGLGGRWDATTALHADILCMTPVDMDHQNVLGHTLTAIAADKAGAIRHGETVVLAKQKPEALRAIREAALMRKARLVHAAHRVPLSSLPPPADAAAPGLHGPHQRRNAQLALAAWRTLARMRGWPVRSAAVAQALHQAFLPGRFQRIAAAPPLPALILDGAHNAHGMRTLCEALREARVRPSMVIFSCLADKDMDALLPWLHEAAADAPIVVPTIADNSRAARSADVAARISSGAVPVPALPQALRMAENPAQRRGDGPVLLCGSLYLLGEFFTLHPRYLVSPLHGEAV